MADVILSRRGHVVEIVGNSLEAVEVATRQTFDVILMDVMMPVMDGTQATAAIRSLGDTDKCAVPIVALTAHAMIGDEERFLAAGMTSYLSKPIHARELIALVERLAED